MTDGDETTTYRQGTGTKSEGGTTCCVLVAVDTGKRNRIAMGIYAWVGLDPGKEQFTLTRQPVERNRTATGISAGNWP
jgi:hypothetical protein